MTRCGPALLLVLLTSAPSIGQPAFGPNEQHFTVIFGLWTPGAPPLRIEDFALKNVLTDDDRNLLAQSVAGGEVRVSGHDASNRADVVSPRARMIVLFTGPLTQNLKLPQPDASTVLYVQEGETFKRYPSGSPLLNRLVEFTPSNKNCSTYWIEQASTGPVGGTVCLPLDSSQVGATTRPPQPPVVGRNVLPPRRVKDAAPVYPAKAIAAGIEGVVMVEIFVDVAGKVSEPRVIRSLPLLDQAAIDCVRQWEYAPALLNGVAVPMRITVTVQFAKP